MTECGGDTLSIWTRFSPSYFLQKLSLKNFQVTPRPHKINFYPFTSSSDLLTFSYIISSIPSNKLKAYSNVFKNAVLSKNLIYDQMTSLQSSIRSVRVFVSFYLTLLSTVLTTFKRKLQMVFSVCGKEHGSYFMERKIEAWKNRLAQVKMQA